MKFYNSIRKVTIHPLVLKRAQEFSVAVAPTTNYSDTNQYSIEKIKNDHLISKIGEEAVKAVLSNYTNVKGPDYSIYKEKQKSWDADLYVGNIGIAVKTQKHSMARRYGLSWVFQAAPNRCDIVLKKPEAWVIFVEYDDITGNLCNVYPPYQIKELIFAEPFLQKLKGYKKVVYANTLSI